MEIHWEWFPPSNLILKGLLLKIPPFFPDNPREFVSLNRELQHLNSPFVRIHFLFRSKASQKHSMIKLKITEPPQCHGKLVTTNIYWNTLSLHISSPRFHRKALSMGLLTPSPAQQESKGKASPMLHILGLSIYDESGQMVNVYLNSCVQTSEEVADSPIPSHPQIGRDMNLIFTTNTTGSWVLPPPR